MTNGQTQLETGMKAKIRKGLNGGGLTVTIVDLSVSRGFAIVKFHDGHEGSYHISDLRPRN